VVVRCLDGRRQTPVADPVDESAGPARPLRGIIEGPTHGLHDSDGLDGRRPERLQHATGLGDRVLQPIGSPGQLAAGAIGIARGDVARRVDVLLGADDQLRDAVVDVVPDAPSLPVTCRST